MKEYHLIGVAPGSFLVVPFFCGVIVIFVSPLGVEAFLVRKLWFSIGGFCVYNGPVDALIGLGSSRACFVR